MNLDPPTVILDDGPILEREDRPRSRTWPILPPPIETIHEHERDAEIAEPPPIIEEDEGEHEAIENEQQKPEPNPRKNSRKNAWGNLSYADLITRAIQSSPEQRLTLSQIYEWMVRNIPYFKDKGDSTSSAGWKNSIRHNLSLHSRFMRVQNDNNGKSSYWVINPDAKPGKSNRRRSGSIDGQQKGEKKRRTKKLHQSTDDISALSPNTMKFKQNRSFDNLFNIGSPCSSTDSLSNLDDFHGDMGYSYNSEAFGRPRSTSNVSNVSSVSGRATPTQLDIDAEIEQSGLAIMSTGPADETANMVESMSIDPQQQQRNMASINLNDSMKIMKTNEMASYGNNCIITNTDPLLPPRRPHSDSFGSGDSGYDSPAYFSPPQQGQGRGMGKLPSPVPAKPPPPYNQAYGNQMGRPTQQMYAPGRMNGYFPPHQNAQQQPQNRMGGMNGHIPAQRLTHLPMQSSYTPHQNIPTYNTQNFNTANPNNMQQMNYMVSTHNMPAPNVTMDSKMSIQNQQQFQQQHHHQQHFMKKPPPTVNVYGVGMDIPDDLTQVELFDFADQQQLASDLDTIIKNELNSSNSCLQNICGPMNNGNSNDTNNNTNMQANNSYPLVGQNWVR